MPKLTFRQRLVIEVGLMAHIGSRTEQASIAAAQGDHFAAAYFDGQAMEAQEVLELVQAGALKPVTMTRAEEALARAN